MKSQRKGLITKMLIVCLLFGTTPVAAAEKQTEESIQVSELACQAEEVVGNEDMVSSIYETASYFVPKMDNFKVKIPKDVEETLVLASGTDTIEMTLPEKTSLCEGIISDEGYVVYEGQNDISIIVQTIEEKLTDVTRRNSVRTMISIPDANAPKEYSFTYDLPDGWRLIMGKELGAVDIVDDAVGIVNGDGYAFASGGSVGWWTGSGSSKSIEITSAFTTGALTATFKVGKIYIKDN